MSTNGTIIVQRPGSNEFASIYVHWDSYPAYVGKILLEHYDTHDKVVELIELGQLSVLRETPDTCVSYHRWRGDDKDINVSSNLNDHTDMEYSYLFRDGEWWLKRYKGVFNLLTIEDCTRD